MWVTTRATGGHPQICVLVKQFHCSCYLNFIEWIMQKRRDTHFLLFGQASSSMRWTLLDIVVIRWSRKSFLDQSVTSRLDTFLKLTISQKSILQIQNILMAMSKLVCINKLIHMFAHFGFATQKRFKKCPSLTKLLPRYDDHHIWWYEGIRLRWGRRWSCKRSEIQWKKNEKYVWNK